MKLKRFLAGLMAACMLATTAPTAAFAEGEELAPAVVAAAMATPENAATPPPEAVLEPTAEPTAEQTEEPAEATEAAPAPATPAAPAPATVATPETAAAAVEAVRKLLAALPETLTAEDWQAMTEEEQAALYEKLEAASDAYDALTDEEKLTLEAEYAHLTELFAVVNADVMPLVAHSHDGINFNQVLNTTGATLAAGNYYLTGDVKLTSKLVVSSGTVNICLNGYNLIQSSAQTAPVLRVEGGTLSIYDCKSSGTITHASGKWGNGIYVMRGTCNLHSGTITGNTYSGGGGGIYVSKDAALNMTGGSITNNTSNAVGGGVHNYGTMTMSGGSITNNTSNYDGDGGGLYYNGSSLSLSGAVTITGNNKANGAARTANNLFVDTGKTLSIAGSLDGSSIYLSLASGNTLPYAFASGSGYALTDADANAFTSDAGNSIERDGNTCKLAEGKAVPAHICDGITFDKLLNDVSASGGTLPAGNYYLKEDMTLTANQLDISSGAVKICLNGHTLTQGSADNGIPVLLVSDGGKATPHNSRLTA